MRRIDNLQLLFDLPSGDDDMKAHNALSSFICYAMDHLGKIAKKR